MEAADTSGTETRWPALLALIGLGGTWLALPQSLVVGPRWLFLAIVFTFLVPTALAHRAGLHRLDMILGYTLSGIVTAALVASLVLLITSLPEKAETPGALLRSAAALWITNVLVFALWYWRLDAGGPHEREEGRGRESAAFLFPQWMQVFPGAGEKRDWSPNFVDYLFLAFNTSTAFSPTDTAVLARWAKMLSMLQALISLLIVAILASRAVGMI